MYFLQYTVIEHSAKESLGGGETPDTCRQRDAFVTGRPCEAQCRKYGMPSSQGRPSELTNLLIKRSRQPPAHTLPRGAWWDAPPAGRSIGRRRREPTGNNPRCQGGQQSLLPEGPICSPVARGWLAQRPSGWRAAQRAILSTVGATARAGRGPGRRTRAAAWEP